MIYTEKIVGRHKIYAKENIQISNHFSLVGGMEYDVIEFVVCGSGHHGFRFIEGHTIMSQCNKKEFLSKYSNKIKLK